MGGQKPVILTLYFFLCGFLFFLIVFLFVPISSYFFLCFLFFSYFSFFSLIFSTRGFSNFSCFQIFKATFRISLWPPTFFPIYIVYNSSIYFHIFPHISTYFHIFPYISIYYMSVYFQQIPIEFTQVIKKHGIMSNLNLIW